MAVFGVSRFNLCRFGDVPDLSGRIATVFNPGRLGGYDVFAKAGSVPVPVTDVPVRRVDRDTQQLTIPEADLSLEANTTCHVGVWPFNVSGYAEQGSEFAFPVDGSGHPLEVPSPVYDLSVEALDGRRAVVRWKYDELLSQATADRFNVLLDRLSPPPPYGLTIATVTHVAPKRDYSVEITLPTDGTWRVRVLSARVGKSVDDVTGVEVIADSAAPAAGVVAMTAE